MAIYSIVKKEEESLRQKAKEVPKVNSSIERLIDNMFDTMYAAEGVGLAAPQIGVSKRVIVVDIGDGPIHLVNPIILEQSGAEADAEGCLSCPGIYGEVERSTYVKVKGLNRFNEEVTIEAKDFFARALQHEIDHLDGVLFIDKAKNVQVQK